MLPNDKVTKDQLAYIFSFFNVHDLNKTKIVNKYFHNLSKKSLVSQREQYKDNIFYAVGSTLHFKTIQQYPDQPTAEKYLRILPQEFAHAITENNEIKLFKNEQDADRYALYRRELNSHGSVSHALQLPIFKVILLDDVGHYPHVNEKLDEDYFDRQFSIIYGFRQKVYLQINELMGYLSLKQLCDEFDYTLVPPSTIYCLTGSLKDYRLLGVNHYSHCHQVEFNALQNEDINQKRLRA